MRFRRAAVVVGTMLGLVSGAAKAAPIITNGGFESGDFTGWSVIDVQGVSPGTGPQVITTGGTNSTGYGDNVPNYEGTKAAYFVDDFALQAITQTVNLAANTTYNLNFALFATESGARNPFPFILLDGISGQVLNAFASVTLGPFTVVPVGVWTPESAQYRTTAAGAYTVGYIFLSGPGAAGDVLLDDVSLSAVPLPASAPLFGAALLALGGIGYAFRRPARAAA